MAVPVTVDADEFTIDELAARTGMTVRTVRFYATEGLLPAPQRRGRVAYYNARHRMRLDLIRTLQDHGIHQGISVHMEHTVVSLLKDADGRCVGAFGFDRERGY